MRTTSVGKRIYLDYVGDLPVADIFRVIPILILDPEVFITNQAKKHARKDHPETYTDYLSMLPDLVKHPAYAGLYDQKEFALQLVTPIELRGEHALVAVHLRTIRDPSMKNTVSSFYRLDEPTFDNRVGAHILRPIPYR